MLKYANGLVDFEGTTFRVEEYRQYSDEIIYKVYVLANGKINTLLVSDMSGTEIKIDATPEVMAIVKKIEEKEARKVKAHNKREYYEYAWREAKKFGLHRSEWEAVHLNIGYRLPRVIPMLQELRRRNELDKLGYRSLVDKILGALDAHDLDALVEIGKNDKFTTPIAFIESDAQSAIYGSY